MTFDLGLDNMTFVAVFEVPGMKIIFMYIPHHRFQREKKHGQKMSKQTYVISSIPTYFENKESPIICYKYNKPIRSTVFNYNKLVTELDIENSIPDS